MAQKVCCAPTENYSTFKTVDVTCSCTKCDSMFCFAKRNDFNGTCSCEDCRESKTCLFYTNRLVSLNESRSDATNTAPYAASYVAPYAVPHAVRSAAPRSVPNAAPRAAPYAASHTSPYATSHGAPYAAPHAAPHTAPYATSHGAPYAAAHAGPHAASHSVPYAACHAEPYGTCHTAPQATTFSANIAAQIGYIAHRVIPNLSSNVMTSATVDNIQPKGLYCGTASKCTSEATTNTNTLDLYKNSIGTSKYTIEELKNTYLSQKNKHVLPANAQPYKLDPEECAPRKSEPTKYTLELYKTASGIQKSVVESLKRIYLPKNKAESKDCNHDVCSQYMSKSPGYILDLQTDQPQKTKTIPVDSLNRNLPENKSSVCNVCSQNASPGYIVDLKTNRPQVIKNIPEQQTYTHILDEKWNTIETPDNKYLQKKKKCYCSDCLREKREPPAYLFGDSGYILELPKVIHVPTAKAQEFAIGKTDSKKNVIEMLKNKYFPHAKNCSCGETAKPDSNTLKLCINLPEVPKNKCDQNKHSCHPKKNVLELCNNILDIQMHTLDTMNEMYSPAGEGEAKTKTKEHKCCNKPTNNTQELYHVKLDAQKNKTNEYLETSCDCNQSAKNKSDLHGYVFDVPRHTQKISCECSAPAKNKSGLPGYVFDVPKYTQKKSCECSASAKTKSPGYVFELPKYKPTKNAQELFKNILETQENAIETLTNKCLKSSCNCNESTKNKSKPPGYVFELPKYKQKQTIQNSNKDEYQKIKCECKESTKITSDSPSYIFDELKYKMPPQNPPNNKQVFNINRLETTNITSETQNSINKKKSCECNVSAKNKSESQGYVFEVPKCIHQSMTQKKNCECNPPKNKSELPGYVFDVPKYTHKSITQKRSCECNPSAKNKSELPGYVYDVPKCTHQSMTQKKKCECSASEKKKSTLPGYVFDVPKYTQKKSCECKPSAKNKSELPGYVFDVPKCAHQSITQKKTCECKPSAKNKSELPGYVFDVPKYTQKKSCECKPSAKNKSELPGYVFDVPKCAHQSITQKKTCECKPSAKNKSELPGYVFDVPKYTQKSITQKKSCECCPSVKNKSELSSDVFEPHQQADNNTQVFNLNRFETKISPPEIKELCKTMLEPQTDTIEILKRFYLPQRTHKLTNDMCKNILEKQTEAVETLKKIYLPQKDSKNCKCQKLSDCSRSKNRDLPLTGPHNDAAPAFSPGTVIPKYKKYEDQKKKCECNESDKSKTESPRYNSELQKIKLSAHELLQKILDKQKYTIETLTNDIKKNSCMCIPPPKCKSQSHEYEKELQKNNNPTNNAQELFTDILETQKNAIETLTNKYQKNSCMCLPSAKCKYQSHEYEIELQEQYNPTSEFLETHKNATETLTSTCQTKASECTVCKKKEYDLPGYVFELPNYTHKQMSPKNKSCECNALSKKKLESPGYVFDVPKYPEKSITQKKSCECNPSAKNKSGKQVYNINRLETKNTPSEAKDSCKNMLGPQTDTIEILKRFYLPHRTSKETNDMCKNILKKQTEAVEILKKIYLPQKKQSQKHNLELKKCKCQNLSEVSRGNNRDLPVTKPQNDAAHACPGTAMLSAEVMDVPYSQFNDSLACKQSNMSNKPRKLSKYDIFKRIKEAYKACSCKVCECIGGKLVKPDVCKCQACECIDCLGYLEKMDFEAATNNLNADSKCPCERCNRKQCPNVAHAVNKRQICDCKPCDCLQCTRSLAKLCDCEPCQCVDCKIRSIHQRQTLVVAPVGREENVQRIACTCSPCDCIECGQVYPLASSVMHEMSTGTNRHALCRCEVCLNETCDQSGVDSCRCEKRNRVMSKPVEKDTHDFDIRTAIVHNKPMLQFVGSKGTRHDTIAMFAAVTNNYPTFVSNDDKSSNMQTCSCDECECISCVCQEDAINAIKSSQLFSSVTRTISDLNVLNTSKFNSSDNYEVHSEDRCCLNVHNSAIHFTTSCGCDMCDCLNCKKDPISFKCSSNISCKYTDCDKMPKDVHRYGRHYRCNDGRCERCYGKKMPISDVYPIKKGDVLTPSTHRFKVQSQILQKRYLGVPSYSAQNVMTNKDSISKMRDVYICNNNQLSEFNTSIKMDFITHANDINSLNTRYMDKYEITKCDAYMQCQEKNKGKSIHKNNSIDNEISGSNFSGYSSFETSPKTSCHKDYGSITPTSRNKNKSWESSCNSSGHDYPEYLIQFPKSTVETCLKDVMELDMDKTIKLDKFNIIPNSTEKDKMSCISGKENSFQMPECNLTHSSNSKFILSKLPEPRKQYKNINNYNETNYSEYTPYVYDLSETALVTSWCRNNKFEISNSVHAQLQNQNDQYNNCEDNKIIKTKDRNQLQGGRRLIDNKSSFKINHENSKYFNIMHNFNEFQLARKVFDYNIAERNATSLLLPIHNDRFLNSWKYSKEIPDYFISGADILDIDDYKRVRKTLKEAKEFTLELIGLLKMYEKANKEFESISEKLKMSHASIDSGDIDKIKEICGFKEEIVEECLVKEKRFSEIEHELQDIHLEAPSVREKLIFTSISQEKGKISENTVVNTDDDSNKILQKLPTYKDILNYQKVSEPIAEYDQSHDFNSVLENNVLEQIETHLNKDEVCCKSAAKEEIIEDHIDITQNVRKTIVKPVEKGLNHENEEIVTIPNNGGIRKKERINNRNHKKYSKLLKRTIIISKRVSVKNSNLNVYKPVIKYCVTVGTSTTVVSETTTDTNVEVNTMLPVNITVKDTQNEHQIHKHEYQLNKIMRKLDTVFGSVEEDTVSTSTNTQELGKGSEEYEFENAAVPHELEEMDPWPILKKNFSWNIKHTKSKKDIVFPSLELDIKQAVQSMSLQTAYPKEQLIVPHRHENQALANLQVEVKKLLDMPILQPRDPIHYPADHAKKILNIQHKNNMESELKEPQELFLQPHCNSVRNADKDVCCSYMNDNLAAQIRDLLNLAVLLPIFKQRIELDDNVATMTRIPSIGGAKTSCEALKVSFLGVRRVSDHTVLVKWNVPRVLDKVQGYELLVDGRPVQKIFSPSKSMAVVTCLPHTDKVLLTIRTITSDVSVTGHYPATTIIYRPRVK